MLCPRQYTPFGFNASSGLAECPSMSDVTRILSQIESGDPPAAVQPA